MAPSGASSQPVAADPSAGGRYVYEAPLGAYVDVTTGELYDPTTGASVGNLSQLGTSPTGGQLAYDQSLGAIVDTANGDVYDIQSGQIVGRLQDGGAAPGKAAGAVTEPSVVNPAIAGRQSLGASPKGGQFVLDPPLGSVIDTATGDVYDPVTREHVGNVNQMGAAPSGAKLMYSWELGAFVDTGNGDVFDPQTQQRVGRIPM